MPRDAGPELPPSDSEAQQRPSQTFLAQPASYQPVYATQPVRQLSSSSNTVAVHMHDCIATYVAIRQLECVVFYYAVKIINKV